MPLLNIHKVRNLRRVTFRFVAGGRERSGWLLAPPRDGMPEIELPSTPSITSSPQSSRRRFSSAQKPASSRSVGGRSDEHVDAAGARDRMEEGTQSLATATEGCIEVFLEKSTTVRSVIAGEVWSTIESEVREAMEGLRLQAGETLAALSEAEMRATRCALKEQTGVFQLKLEHSRVAAKRSLENQAAEIEATHQKALEIRRQQLADGGASALAR